jgi:hypothetical protein
MSQGYPYGPPRLVTDQMLIAQLRGEIERLKRRPPRPSPHEIKVFGDLQLVAAGDGAFEFEVEDGLDQHRFWTVAAYVTTVGSGDTVVQLHNIDTAVDVLSTPITIEAGDKKSRSAAAQPVVLEAAALVTAGDHIRVDVDSAGSGSKGLGLIIRWRL